MKLLYAEDEPGLSEAVVDILTYYKYQVDAVDNGTDAYDYAKAEPYDGIILDVMMPGMSGLEVLQKLRQEGCRTPMLAVTVLLILLLGAINLINLGMVQRDLKDTLQMVADRVDKAVPVAMALPEASADPER